MTITTSQHNTVPLPPSLILIWNKKAKKKPENSSPHPHLQKMWISLRYAALRVLGQYLSDDQLSLQGFSSDEVLPAPTSGIPSTQKMLGNPKSIPTRSRRGGTRERTFKC